MEIGKISKISKIINSLQKSSTSRQIINKNSWLNNKSKSKQIANKIKKNILLNKSFKSQFYKDL